MSVDRENPVWLKLRRRFRASFSGPNVIAIVPLFILAGYWGFGENGLLAVAVGLPVLFAAAGGFHTPVLSREEYTNGIPIFSELTGASELADDVLLLAKTKSSKTCCFLIEIEDFQTVSARHGDYGAQIVIHQACDRLISATRDTDRLIRIGDCRFVVLSSPSDRLDLEGGIQIASRIQSMMEEPISLDGLSVFVSCAVGFCLSTRAPDGSGLAMLHSAEIAMLEARKNGPSAIRAFSSEMQTHVHQRVSLRQAAVAALENGQIVPWYQPQLCSDTGRVTGFEALARWEHPKRGIIPPGDFLKALEDNGQLEHLCEAMLQGAFQALANWDKSGLKIDSVGVNFTQEDLRSPNLVDRIKWELDRFDLAASRLCIEILESVVACAPDDMTCRNINTLSALGCRIDLDDFGTGHASISSLKRFDVTRLKIDRSFVRHADRDEEQQRMISAVLTMAERLEIDTLAEGVETKGEHAAVSQLGCGHVQGFAIARPMPFRETIDWVKTHEQRMANVVTLSQ